MKHVKKRFLLIAGALILSATACTLQRAEANNWACSFGAGPWDTKNLKHSFAPGEKGSWSNDNMVSGPSDVRYYYIDNDPNTADQNATPLILPARGSAISGVGVVDTSTEVQVRFVFNERFCEWYIAHGRRNDVNPSLNFNATNDQASGWQNFLNVSMNQKLLEATRPVVRDVDYITLYTNGPIGDAGELAYDVLATRLSANLSKELDKDLGGEYFCGPSYKFDGNIDGKLDNGCPPLEVTVKRVVPVDDTLIQKLRDIVNNEEQQRKIASDTELAKKETAADRERTVAQTEAASTKAVAQAAANQATQVAEASADQAIKIAQANAGREVQIAQTEANREVQLAQQNAEQQVQLAQAAKDLAVAQARGPVATQLAENKKADQHAEAQFCLDLAGVGVDCALLEAAGNSNYPPINITGSADGGGSAGTTILLDARG